MKNEKLNTRKKRSSKKSHKILLVNKIKRSVKQKCCARVFICVMGEVMYSKKIHKYQKHFILSTGSGPQSLLLHFKTRGVSSLTLLLQLFNQQTVNILLQFGCLAARGLNSAAFISRPVTSDSKTLCPATFRYKERNKLGRKYF